VKGKGRDFKMFAKETSKHSGAFSLFDKDYVKTGIFPKEFSQWPHHTFDLKQQSDYAVEDLPSRNEVEETINQAFLFVEKVKEVLKSKLERAGKL
jgi:uncharacterized protein (UPF0332 family)